MVVLGKAAGGLPLFPALTRLELNTGHLTMDAAAMPALRQMGLVARSPAVACDLRAATQLTSLRWGLQHALGMLPAWMGGQTPRNLSQGSFCKHL